MRYITLAQGNIFAAYQPLTTPVGSFFGSTTCSWSACPSPSILYLRHMLNIPRPSSLTLYLCASASNSCVHATLTPNKATRNPHSLTQHISTTRLVWCGVKSPRHDKALDRVMVHRRIFMDTFLWQYQSSTRATVEPTLPSLLK